MPENEEQSTIVADKPIEEQLTEVAPSEETLATQPTKPSEPEVDREAIAQTILKDSDLPPEDFERAINDPAYMDELVTAYLEAEKEEKEKSVATPVEKAGKAETEGESETPGEEGEKGKKSKGGWQRRIDRLTQRNYELEASLEETQSRLRKLESTQAKTSASGQPQETIAAESEEPKEENFEQHDDYLKAKIRYVARQEVKAATDQLRKEQAEQTEQHSRDEAQARLNTAWTEQRRAAEQKHPDFDEVTEGIGEPIPGQPGVRKLRDDIAVALLHTGQTGEILYWWGKNPEQYDRISRLPSIAAIVEIGKIAAQFKPSASGKSPPNNKPNVSSAPPPSRKLGAANNEGAKDLSYYRDSNRCGIAELEKKLTGV